MAEVPKDRPGVGGRLAKPSEIVVTALVLGAFAGVLFYTLIQFWPDAPSQGGQVKPSEQTSFFGTRVTLSREEAIFLIVAVAGALGASVHVLRSFWWYVGNRTLRRSWLLMYYLLPLVGGALGLIFYIVLRAGLISTQASAADVSPYGMAAVAALAGLFSQQASNKLKEVFETLLTTAERGEDSTPPADEGPAPGPSIESSSPRGGPPGSRVTIWGSGLQGATAVVFGAAIAAPTRVADEELEAVVPEGATTAPIEITTPAGRAVTQTEFRAGANEPVLSVKTIDPSSGAAGQEVVITGTGFLGVTAVTVGGSPADFRDVSDQKITAIVPSGATSGPVAVIVGDARARSETFTVTEDSTAGAGSSSTSAT